MWHGYRWRCCAHAHTTPECPFGCRKSLHGRVHLDMFTWTCVVPDVDNLLKLQMNAQQDQGTSHGLTSARPDSAAAPDDGAPINPHRRLHDRNTHKYLLGQLKSRF